MEPAERRKVSLMQALSTIRNEKVAIRKQAAQRRKEVLHAFVFLTVVLPGVTVLVPQSVAIKVSWCD